MTIDAVVSGVSFERLKEFLDEQRHEIEVHVWIRSEQAGCDLHREASMEWVIKHAAAFRAHWESKHGKL